MQVLKPPAELLYGSPEYHVFFAGSIEMNAAEDWQERLTKMLAPLPGVILNPRRDAWDSSWEQKFTNAKFKEQVDWELDAMDMADRIIMYFDPNTKSPITLLELGLYATSNKLLVCCPNGFWRKGNVDIVCKRYDIQQVNTLEEIRDAVEFDLQLSDVIDSICGRKDNGNIVPDSP
jgi:hypothetical protein